MPIEEGHAIKRATKDIKTYLTKQFPTLKAWDESTSEMIATELAKIGVEDVWITSIKNYTKHEEMFVIFANDESIAIFLNVIHEWELVTPEAIGAEKWAIGDVYHAKTIWYMYHNGSGGDFRMSTETEAEDMVLVYCDGQEIKWSQHQEHVSVAPDVEAFNQKHYGGKLTRRQLSLLHHELKRISYETRGQKA